MSVKPRRGAYRKFGSVRILRDGRVRLSPWTLPGLPRLDFITVYADEDPVSNYTLHAQYSGRTLFMLYVTRNRVDNTCFAYDLSPDELRDAIDILRDAGNGLERWIIPGLEWCQREFARMKPNPNREALKAVIPELLESVRDLPVAPQWPRRLRFLERWEREHAGAPNEGQRPSVPSPPRARAPARRRSRGAS